MLDTGVDADQLGAGNWRRAGLLPLQRAGCDQFVDAPLVAFEHATISLGELDLLSAIGDALLDEASIGDGRLATEEALPLLLDIRPRPIGQVRDARGHRCGRSRGRGLLHHACGLR